MKDVEVSEANLRECFNRKNGARAGGCCIWLVSPWFSPTLSGFLSDFWAVL
jgi:hypothetical protein